MMSLRAVGLLQMLLLVASCAAMPAPSDVLWPLPRTVDCTPGDGAAVSKSFSITSHSQSAVLGAAIKRYADIFKPFLGGRDGTHVVSPSLGSEPAHVKSGAVLASELTRLDITVASPSEALVPNTSFEYKLSFDVASSEAVTLSADTIYGAMAGLETFSQLFLDGSVGKLIAASCHVDDGPQFIHRGLLVDSGRRFLPIPLLQNVIASMSYSKMNVLHLHLSDWAAVRMEVPEYPELTSSLNGQFYTTEQAKALVQFAKEHAVRIVAEIDVPAHSSGFAPLESRGVEFCDSSKTLMYNDPATNSTLKVVSAVIAAVANVFPDPMFHLGGDETVPVGKCTFDAIHTFEKQLQSVVNDLKRQPAVWNEVFSNPPTSEPNGALPGTVIQNWHDSGSSTTAAAGFQSLVSTYNELYLDQQCCAAGPAAASNGTRLKQCYWFDLNTGVDPSLQKLVIGGETAMWTDMYCGAPNCPQDGPWAEWYTSKFDSQFTESFVSLIWPRAAGAAGSFWHYTAAVASDSAQYASLITAHNSRLIARGSISCPNGCACDWNSKCGKPYGVTPPMPMAVTLVNNASFKVTVKEVFPCVSQHGNDIIKLEAGQSTVVHTDFIVQGGSPLRSGDPFDLWFGGPGWRSCTQKLSIQEDPHAKGYLDYVVVA